MLPRVGIVSFAGDLHVKAIENSIKALDAEVIVHVFEVDNLAAYPGFFECSLGGCKAVLTDRDSIEVDIGDLCVVWWRRASFPQKNTLGDPESPDSKIINRDSYAFVEGLFLTSFFGEWVNHPLSARAAENKLIQIACARSAGLCIPETIFTNHYGRIQKAQSEEGEYIVKTIAGLPGKSLLTQRLSSELLESAGVSESPACYQSMVVGGTHLRVLVAGMSYAAAKIESFEVDSRSDAFSITTPTDIDPDLIRKLTLVLSGLNLSMGIFDLKIDKHAVPNFLEANQQGQFLYLDVMAGCSFVPTVARYLMSAARRVCLSRRSTSEFNIVRVN